VLLLDRGFHSVEAAPPQEAGHTLRRRSPENRGDQAPAEGPRQEQAARSPLPDEGPDTPRGGGQGSPSSPTTEGAGSPFLCWGVDLGEAKRYSLRWGIETCFRMVKKHRARTCSRSLPLRWLLLLTSTLLTSTLLPPRVPPRPPGGGTAGKPAETSPSPSSSPYCSASPANHPNIVRKMGVGVGSGACLWLSGGVSLSFRGCSSGWFVRCGFFGSCSAGGVRRLEPSVRWGVACATPRRRRSSCSRSEDVVQQRSAVHPGPRHELQDRGVSYAETLSARCGCEHRQQKRQHHEQNVATTPWGDLADGFSRSKPPLLRSLKRTSTLQRSL